MRRLVTLVWLLFVSGAADAAQAQKEVEALTEAITKADSTALFPALDAVKKAKLEKEAVEQLTKLLAHEMTDVRVVAVVAAKQLGAVEAAGPALLGLLDEKDPRPLKIAAVIVGDLPQLGAKSGPKLLALIAHEDHELATQAINSLIVLGQKSPEVIKLLAKEFETAERDRRRDLAFIVASIGPAAKDAAPGLSRIVADDGERLGVRLTAAAAEWNVAKHESGGVALATKALSDKDAKVRAQAVTVLRMAGGKTTSTIDALITALDDADQGVATDAAVGLGAIGQPALDKLTKLLGAEKPRMRASAAYALGEMHETALPALKDLMNNLADDDVQVRLQSVSAIGAMGPAAKEAMTAVKLVRNDKEKSIRVTASVALWKITGKPNTVVEVFQEVFADKDSDHYDRLALVEIAGDLGAAAEPLVPELIKQLEHEDAEFRFYSAVALGKLGATALKAKPALEGLSKDAHPEVRNAAAKALEKIDAKP